MSILMYNESELDICIYLLFTKRRRANMELTKYGNFNRQLYVSDNCIDTMLNQGEIFFKRSQYSNEMEAIERDFGYIAKYRIAFNKREQKSDASIHVHIAKIDVKKKQDRLMTTTLAFLIYTLLESYPDDKIEISLHQSASEVSYKEKNIYERLLSQVFISGELPYIYDVFTVESREKDLAYYHKLIQASKYEIGIVSDDDYQRLPIDQLKMKEELSQLIRAMMRLDLEINERDITLKNIMKIYRRYKTKDKVEKRMGYIIKSMTALNHKASLDQLLQDYMSKKHRYHNVIRQLSDKEVNEIYRNLQHDIKDLKEIDHILRK